MSDGSVSWDPSHCLENRGEIDHTGMHKMNSHEAPKASRAQTYPGHTLLLGFILLLELTHLFALCCIPHPVIASNVVQLFPPALLCLVSLRQRGRSRNTLARRRWAALIVAFLLWGVAQGFYLYYLLRPERGPALLRPDNILWLVFSLPLLLITMMTKEKIDQIGWLDRLQVGLFFVVLYLLVFLPSTHLRMDFVLCVQDAALLLCLISRLAACQDAAERRFLVRLLAYLVSYRLLAGAAVLGATRGFPPGSLIDVVWTLPISAFAAWILWDERLLAREHDLPRSLLKAAQGTQGFSVAVLAFLSIAASATLSGHRPLLGGALIVASFVLFALRTSTRERAWYQAHSRLEKTALHDALTGLGNRTMLRRKLEEHLQPASGRPGCPVLVFADLDRFKAVNDSLGHTLGDQLLIAVANRLRAAAPARSVICRHGGDEFVLLATAADAGAATAIGEALLHALRPSYQLQGHNLQCTASIGIVLAAPDETADELLRTADHAMYRAKQLGKDCVQFFDERLRTQMDHHWRLEADLRTCLQGDGLEVAFQPILTVEGGEICGFEALARWHHPVLGNITPAEFIPLAEESGLILPLGAQILEKACRQVAAWNRLWDTELSLSVNVSPRQFADSDLLAAVMEILARTQFPAHLLQLEITESSLLVNQELARQTLSAARSHGIHISLDDFGTGYSSLAFLLNLPVDEVKVDRSFVSEMRHDPHRKELVRTVISLGKSLGKRVVAEGVETEEDLLELAAMGCECAQGWLIGRPMSAEATEAGLPSIAPMVRRDYSINALTSTLGDGIVCGPMDSREELLRPSSVQFSSAEIF